MTKPVAALALRPAHDEHIIVVLLNERGVELHLGIVGLGHVGGHGARLLGVGHFLADIAQRRLDLDAQNLVEVGVRVGVHDQNGAFFLLAQIVNDHAAGRRLADAAFSGNCNDMGLGHKNRSLERGSGRPGIRRPARIGMQLNEVDQTGFLCDVGDVIVLVERVQMDAVNAAGAVLVDLVDGVFDTGLAEAFLLGRRRLRRTAPCRTGSGRSSSWR